MKTRCPYCDTRYDIEEDTLQATDGLARCYRCEGIFNAYEQFLPDLAPATLLTPSQPVDVDRLATRLRADQSLPPSDSAQAPPQPPPSRPLPTAADEPPHDGALAEEDWDADLIDLDTGERRRRSPWRTAGGVLTIVVLSAGLAGTRLGTRPGIGPTAARAGLRAIRLHRTPAPGAAALRGHAAAATTRRHRAGRHAARRQFP
jgi:predicted Zn finger-like uncharacterized protein